MEPPFYRIRLTEAPEFIRYDQILTKIRPNLHSYELWSIVKGNGDLRIENEIYALKAGFAFIFPPNSSPILSQDESHELLMFRASFDLLNAQEQRSESLQRMALNLQNSEFFFQLAHNSCNSFERGDALGLMRSRHLVEEMILQMLDEYQRPSFSKTYVAIDSVISEIQHDPAKPWKLGDLAKRVGLSRFHFLRIFKKITGMSPNRFIIQARLVRATRLIQDTDLTLSEIAEATGYNNVYFFSEQYKKFMGHNPSDLRKKNKALLQELLKRRKKRTLISIREHEFEKITHARTEAKMRELENRMVVESKRDWELIVDQDLNHDFTEKWKIHGGTWQIKNGTLEVSAGTPTIVVIRDSIPAGDIAVEFECYQEGPYLNDISCFFSGISNRKIHQIPEAGYTFMYGACGNSINALDYNNKSLWLKKASPLKARERYHIRAERWGGRCILTVNQKVIFDVQHENSSLDKQVFVGFYLWKAKTIFTRIRILQLRAPMKEDLLSLATHHLQSYHFSAAIEMFQKVIDSSKELKRRELAKRGLEDAISKFQISRLSLSFEKLLLQVWPNARIQGTPEGLIINIKFCGISDLSPLRGLPVTQLDCDDNNITSLEPLRGLKLTKLWCQRNQITDLSPIENMPLELLYASENQISSLECLKGMPLQRFACRNNKIRDLSPLAEMPLIFLDCSSNEIERLSFVSTSLQKLRISNNRITDLNGLKNLSLIELDCSNNKIRSLKPVQGSRLKNCNCRCNQITSLTTFKGMYLEKLICDSNPITKLDPFLEDQSLEVYHFDCDSIPVKELEKSICRWKQYPPFKQFARDAEVLLALRTRDLSKLKSYADPFQDSLILRVPKMLSWNEAKSYCETLQGNLVIILDENKNQLIKKLSHFEECWIGLDYCPENPIWVTGMDLDFKDFISEPKHVGPVSCTFSGWTIRFVPQELPFLIEWRR
jgi:Leucine-rich repeat (LRR) protein/AraC-like DNA-binding protein